MKKKSRTFTFIVIPHEGKVKKVHLSSRALWGVLFAGGFIALMAALLPYVAGKAYSLYKVNKILSLKVESQEKRLSELGRRIQKLEMKLADVEHLSKKIRDIAIGAEEGSVGMMMGVGGIGLDMSFPDLEKSSTYDVLKARMGALEKRIQQEEIILDGIFTALNDKRSLLDSTPSIWPVKGWVTSEFGYRVDPFTGRQELHEGLDIAARLGTPVVAPADGIVIYARYERSFGNTIIIDHGYGFSTLYGHLAEIYVRAGDKVKRGQVIGAVGNTGRSTGPHLHYEVRKNGVPVDPRDYILE